MLDEQRMEVVLIAEGACAPVPHGSAASEPHAEVRAVGDWEKGWEVSGPVLLVLAASKLLMATVDVVRKKERGRRPGPEVNRGHHYPFLSFLSFHLASYPIELGIQLLSVGTGPPKTGASLCA